MKVERLPQLHIISVMGLGDFSLCAFFWITFCAYEVATQFQVKFKRYRTSLCLVPSWLQQSFLLWTMLLLLKVINERTTCRKESKTKHMTPEASTPRNPFGDRAETRNQPRTCALVAQGLHRTTSSSPRLKCLFSQLSSKKKLRSLSEKSAPDAFLTRR